MLLMPILIEAVMLLLFGRKQKSFEKIISKCLQNAVHVSVKNFYDSLSSINVEFLSEVGQVVSKLWIENGLVISMNFVQCSGNLRHFRPK